MLKSYVKRSGRFTDAQKNAYGSLADRFIAAVPRDCSADGKLGLKNIFGNDSPVTMEIGFGMGLATAIIAEDNPEKNYLGIEVHKPGIGRLLWEIEKRSLSNIRIIEADAADVVKNLLPASSLEAIHVFFPDPWPKKRHHKRRLMQKPFSDDLAACLKEGGYLYMATDWEDYAESALNELTATAGLKNAYDGFAEPQSWRPKTKFELKGIAKGHVIRELYFVKG